MVRAMIDTHECLWCKKTIQKTVLFCSNECLLAYNKQNKTKKDLTNWTYIEEQRPGTKTKIRIAWWVMFGGIFFLDCLRKYSGLSVEAFTIEGLVLGAVCLTYIIRKHNLK